jgi:hypothetical protein
MCSSYDEMNETGNEVARVIPRVVGRLAGRVLATGTFKISFRTPSTFN